ncbi:MAG: hypothetical protein ACAI43_05610 [Phycisphaerae bacterium]|nr:hypothetical protein [Tepidisphaeraceae bacterium]
MSTAQLERRLKALEDEMALLKRAVASGSGGSTKGGWRAVVGAFANDPLYAKAMALGRKYRESLRPSRKRGAR